MEDKFKYTAFISYSHADQGVVKWLHHALEKYRVPVTLVGQETRAGKVPKKFKPVFRDRDDLSAASSLSDSIREALSQSKFLIVVCSPEAAESPWVNKEISDFKKLRGRDNILCLIARSNEEGKMPPFPKALNEGEKGKQPFEPIAADMRPSGDGKRMAKLKLISGLLGVELDTIIQRDSKRRQIQMVVMAATFSVATIVLSVLLFMAVEARNEAEANRQKAEDLVGFMLGDLREKLEPSGSLQMMDTIALKALDYYASVDPKKMTTEGLARRSRVLLMLGETQELRGNTDAARGAFLDAYLATGELLEREPKNPGLLYDYSQSTYWLGFIDLRLKNYESAETYFQEYAKNSETLVSLEPENQEYRAEMGYAYSNLGIVLFSQGKFAAAQEDFEKALDVHVTRGEKNLESQDVQFDLAQAYAWLADAKKELGQFAEAENLRQRELRVYSDILKANPDNRPVWGSYAWTYRALGTLAFLQGQEKKSLGLFDTGIQTLSNLIAYDRENTDWKEKLTQLYIDKARALIGRRDYKGAVANLGTATELAKGLLAINPDFTSWILADFKARMLMADVKLKTRKKEEALALAQNLSSEFYRAFPPETRTSEMHFLAAEILDVLAEAYQKNGDDEAAKKNWKSVVGVLGPYEATGGVTVISLLPKAQKQISD